MIEASRTALTYCYERWRALASGVLESAGDTFLLLIAVRTTKVAEELAVVRELPSTRLCEDDEVECRLATACKTDPALLASLKL